MDFEYSPHRSGGTLLTHSQYDPFPSIQQLRRSLSRSPSKPSRFHLHNVRSPHQSPTSPLSPSSLSRAYFVDSGAASASHSRPKFTLRKTTSQKSAPRRTSPISPDRRILTDGSSKSNAAHISLPFRNSASGQENARSANNDIPKIMRFELNNEPIKFDLLKAHAVREDPIQAKSSPLKRSDGVMNLDSPSIGSPRAKRRSLHGAVLGADFNVYDHAFGDNGPPRRNSSEEPSIQCPPQPRSPQRRPFSLRKSTLQQRTGGAAAKSRQAHDSTDTQLASPRPNLSTSPSATRARYRMSLDGSLPLRALDQVSLCSAPPQKPVMGQRPHPLSNTLTPSSSNSSFTEEPSLQDVLAAALEPPPEPAKTKANFSKSLPIGALRPRLDRTGESEGADSFETPETFRSARPLPAAFMSTGLISKRNRDVDLPQSGFGSSTAMPDTPSKKFTLPSASATPIPSTGLGKVSHPQHEFGSPTAPFSPHTHRGSPESFGKGVSIFGSRVAQGRLIRRASFLSIENEDMNSPSSQMDTQAALDELPPTPTKPAPGGPRPPSKGRGNSLRSSLLGRRPSIAPDTFRLPPPTTDPRIPRIDTDRKSSSVTFTPTHQHHDENMTMASRTPFITLSPSESHQTASTRPLSLMERSPSPLSFRSSKASSSNKAKNGEITIQVAPFSLDGTAFEGPLTPQEAFTPPDASRLYISNDNRTSFGTSVSGLPPATPTGPRDNPFAFSTSTAAGGSSMLQNDVDTTLTSRWGSVHVYGIGEFSIVYRVENPLEDRPPPSQGVDQSLGKVWVVKKSKKPYAGSKDRSRKMKEVQILKALRGNEHVVEMVDTWEMKNHLYIQTEFCENGNLKDFLSQAGYKARLDDFRIWKILLELSLGLKSVHDAGYIHLDLKPANVFIDWEGVLKIGDFGMASVWPAPRHLDGEGDREYIAPEVLSGRFDKPADIFALGMIMLEIAGNIVLPDNGLFWQRLRSGDMSDLPSLSFSSDSTLIRDESGDPVGMLDELSDETLTATAEDDDNDLGFCSRRMVATPRARDLVQPPDFMVDSKNAQSLEKLVQGLISPDPDARPFVDEVLGSNGVRWVSYRRRAGATIYEGNWGPADDVINATQDVDMVDI